MSGQRCQDYIVKIRHFPAKLGFAQQEVAMYQTAVQQTEKKISERLWGPRPLEPKEIDGLLMPAGKASMLLTDHLITG